jgi:hypothetical protein
VSLETKAWIKSNEAKRCANCEEIIAPNSYMVWNYVHGYATGCWKCTNVPQQIKNEMLKNELKQIKSAFETDPPKPAPKPAPEPTPTPKPDPEPTPEPGSKAPSAAALKKSKVAVAASSAALKNSNLTNNIEKDNGETTMATQTSTPTAACTDTLTCPAVETVLSITSDRKLSVLANVMNCGAGGGELGGAGAASGSATDYVVARVSKTWPVAGAFITATPLVRPAMDFVVPLGVGIVTWNKWVPGVSPERQEKIANWCLIAISSHVDTIMSKIGRDFFSSLFKHMENAVADWNSNPLGN